MLSIRSPILVGDWCRCSGASDQCLTLLDVEHAEAALLAPVIPDAGDTKFEACASAAFFGQPDAPSRTLCPSRRHCIVVHEHRRGQPVNASARCRGGDWPATWHGAVQLQLREIVLRLCLDAVGTGFRGRCPVCSGHGFQLHPLPGCLVLSCLCGDPGLARLSIWRILDVPVVTSCAVEFAS